MFAFAFHFKKGALYYLNVEPYEPDKSLKIPEELNTTDYVVPIKKFYHNLVWIKRIVGCVFCCHTPFLLV